MMFVNASTPSHPAVHMTEVFSARCEFFQRKVLFFLSFFPVFSFLLGWLLWLGSYSEIEAEMAADTVCVQDLVFLLAVSSRLSARFFHLQLSAL